MLAPAGLADPEGGRTRAGSGPEQPATAAAWSVGLTRHDDRPFVARREAIPAESGRGESSEAALKTLGRESRESARVSRSTRSLNFSPRLPQQPQLIAASPHATPADRCRPRTRRYVPPSVVARATRGQQHATPQRRIGNGLQRRLVVGGGGRRPAPVARRMREQQPGPGLSIGPAVPALGGLALGLHRPSTATVTATCHPLKGCGCGGSL